MVEKNFDDISGALPVFDHIIIGGKSEEEHDLILGRFWQEQENVILSSTVTQFNSVLTNSSIWMKLLVNWASHLTQKKIRLFITYPHPHASKTYKGYLA